jgi:hypothetical protein
LEGSWFLQIMQPNQMQVGYLEALMLPSQVQAKQAI